MKTCHSCGMPLVGTEEFATHSLAPDFCRYCTLADGSVKPCAEVFAMGVNHYMHHFEMGREAAERLTRSVMSHQPHWKHNPCETLQGEHATEEEYKKAMNSMS